MTRTNVTTLSGTIETTKRGAILRELRELRAAVELLKR